MVSGVFFKQGKAGSGQTAGRANCTALPPFLLAIHNPLTSGTILAGVPELSSTVIRVDAIGKEYRVGALDAMGGPGLLRDKIAGAVRNPLGLLKRKPKETFWALKDVSFEVKEGEVLGLIGRNGAGKSTLLKILSRITKPTVGHAEIHGRVGSLLEVGTGFHPELTGRENVFLNGAILGMRRREIARKFDEIVAFAEVEKFIDTPVKHYSSGMYVRLAFAVAAHLETEILFVDEVLSVGDVAFQKKCMGKMGDVARHGRTIIFVSHNVNAVAALCQSAMLLEHGKLAFRSQNVNEVLRRYSSHRTNAHTVDLSGQPRNRGGGVFQEISLVDEERGPSHCVAPGANFAVSLKVKPPRAIVNPKVTLAVTSYRGERVFAVGTNIGGNEIPVVDAPSSVVVRFTMPLLVAGEYALDIGIYDRTGTPLDEIHGAASLEVLNDGYLSTVEEHNHHMGYIMVRSEWSCVEGDARDSSGLISAGRCDSNSAARRTNS